MRKSSVSWVSTAHLQRLVGSSPKATKWHLASNQTQVNNFQSPQSGQGHSNSTLLIQSVQASWLFQSPQAGQGRSNVAPENLLTRDMNFQSPQAGQGRSNLVPRCPRTERRSTFSPLKRGKAAPTQSRYEWTAH